MATDNIVSFRRPSEETRPAEERFWNFVDVRLLDECWLWTGKIGAQGYGLVGPSTDRKRAHRVAWEIASGHLIPAGMVVCHHCDNPPCCNPAHLFVGTQGDNMRDMVAKGRHGCTKRTHCAKGHPYSPENTYFFRTARRCRTCVRAATARWRAAKNGRAA